MDDNWMIPDERDMMSVPEKPDLTCSEHGSVCEVMHSVYNRLLELEERIRVLEGK